MNRFFLTDQEKEIENLSNIYKLSILKHTKNGNLNLLEYSYLLDFYENKGTLVNASWYISLINKLNDTELCSSIEKLFPELFKKKDSQIKFKIKDFKKAIIKDKKQQINFTDDQSVAIQQIFQFLPDYNKNAYLLKGFAGTGKSTTIVEIVTFLLKNKFIKSVAMSACTNKATNVLKYKFQIHIKELYNTFFGKDPPETKSFDEIIGDIETSHNVKIDFITIHKLLKFELDFGSDGQLEFIKKSGKSLLGDYDVIIIDECSMIPVKLAEYIFTELRLKTQKACDNFKKTSKVIICGDPSQLNPVGEDMSVIFIDSIPKKSINKISVDENFFNMYKKDIAENNYKMLVNDIINMQSYTLKQVMRTNRDSVKNVCYQIRLWAMNEIKYPNLKPHIKNGVKVYKYVGGSKINTDWFKKCISYFKSGQNCNTILTWTNKQADEYNMTIRNELFNKKAIKKFEIGDILMLNDFYNLENEKTDYLNDSDNKFYTSEQIKVIKTEIVNKKIPDFNTTLNKIASKLADNKYYDAKQKETVNIINNNTNRSYVCWKLTVTKISDNVSSGDLTTSTLLVIHDDSNNIWDQEKTFISNCIKKLRSILISKLRDKTVTIENNIIKPLWKEWHKNMVEPFANVNYGYAITCHKGQGSNFYNVFVDIDDITKNDKHEETKKCIYTAITRTSNELHILMAS